MKALLLAAGVGSRLRPLTDTVPKCLVPIAGRPLLTYWIELFERHGVTDVLMNLHHLPEQVRAFVALHPTSVRFSLVEEPVLLGSAGTLWTNRHFVDDGEPFVVAYADNLTSVDLGAMARAHRQWGSIFTMGLFRADQPARCGIADVAPDNRVVHFEEKPEHPRSDLANAGLYMTDARLFDRLPTGPPPFDFGHHVLPALVGEMYGYEIPEPLIDIGTWESYQRAEREVASMGFESAAGRWEMVR